MSISLGSPVRSCTGSRDVWGLRLAQCRSADLFRGSWNPRDRKPCRIFQNASKCAKLPLHFQLSRQLRLRMKSTLSIYQVILAFLGQQEVRGGAWPPSVQLPPVLPEQGVSLQNSLGWSTVCDCISSKQLPSHLRRKC